MPGYAATIFLSAFLLFLVQPIIARQILPWFGGAAAVWAVCLVFFQSALLAGYAYADFTSRRLAPRTQALLHIALLAISLVLLPILPDARWKPGAQAGGAPTLQILGLLAATIGLPYFLLAATSPLLQAWYWRHFRHAAPYRLFALSNFASLLALLCYPVAVEPWLRGVVQSHAWSVLYVIFALLCARMAWLSARNASAAPHPSAPPPADLDAAAPALGARLAWIVYAAMGSCLLLGVTNHLTQNIASVPFLWVVPLSLYLLTFILCFDHPRWYSRRLIFAALAVALPAMAWFSGSLDLYFAAPLYGAGLFVCCMFCHGELYHARPAPPYLTTFYLMIAIGGALGALLIGIGAPLWLRGYFELDIALVACALLLSWNSLRLPRAIAYQGFAAVCLTALFAVRNVAEYSQDMRVMVRNFYGVVRTRDYASPTPFRVLYHGAINHGGQLLAPGRQRTPSTYFGPGSGYGRAFAALRERNGDRPLRVGVIGLGAGAIAAYSRRGDLFRFYEIDPKVAAVAVMEFSFLKDSPAQVDIALGDGRLALEREPPQQFDLLAIDAFAGDSIPMHLLTREAMAIYARHLAPQGVMVFQATNRYVAIAPVVERLADAFGLGAAMVNDDPAPDAHAGTDFWLSPTEQILVTADRALLLASSLKEAARPLARAPGFRVWTDDHYNLLSILRP